MANEPDIKLLFGVEGGASIDEGSGKQIFDDLKGIVRNINGKDALKVKVGLDDSSAKEFKEQLKSVVNGADASSGVVVKISGLDKTAEDAAKAAKSLESVADSAKKAGASDPADALAKGTKEYNDALTKINTLLIQLRNNQRNWSAASGGKGADDLTKIQGQITALQALEDRLAKGELTAEGFADEMSRIRAVATDAAESINKLGENRASAKILTKDTREYNDALAKSYSLLGQIATKKAQWESHPTVLSSDHFKSFNGSIYDVRSLIDSLQTGSLSADSFASSISNIRANVASADSELKSMGNSVKIATARINAGNLAKINIELKGIQQKNRAIAKQYDKIQADRNAQPFNMDLLLEDASLDGRYTELMQQTEALSLRRKTATYADISSLRSLQQEVERLISLKIKQSDVSVESANSDVSAANKSKASLKEIITLYDRIDRYLLNNQRSEGTAQYNELKDIRNRLYGVMQESRGAADGLTSMSKVQFKDLDGQTKSLTESLHTAGREGNGFVKTITAAYQKFGGWMLVTQSLTKVINGLKQMVENVKQIDLAMTELKKVTNETDATYNQFLRNATVRASQLGSTVSDVVSATAEFSKLGHTLEDATKLADAAMVYKNVGDGIEDITVASQSIISTMQAFGYTANDAMLIVDKFNHIANRYAIDSAGLGESLMRSASAMASANNTLDETIALTTAANTILQDPQVVGTTMKTLSMYLRAAKTEAEEAGESTDGMANSVSELRDELLSLTGGAVDIMIDEDSFKSSYQILKELSLVWDELTDVSQANILEMIGGKRNANAVAAILTNFDIAESVLKDSANATGSALAENEKYLDSIAGKADKFKAAFESLSIEVVDSGFVKFVIDLGTAIAKLATTLQRIGALIPTIAGVWGIFSGIKAASEINDLTQKISGNTNAILLNNGSAKNLTDTVAALSRQNKKLLFNQLEQALASEGIDEAQKQQILSTLALDKAQDKLGSSAGSLGKSFMGVVSAIPKWQLAIMAVSTVISVVGAIKDRIEQTRQAAIDAAEEIARAYSDAQNNCESNIDALNNIRDRYNELSKAVGENGENIGLTASQYDEYLDLVRQIADISPDIVRGLANETAAMASYDDAIQAAIDSQKELLRVQREAYLGGGRELFAGAKSEYENALSSILDSTYYLTTEYSDSGSATRDVFDTLGISIDPDDTESAARIIHENRDRILSEYENLGYSTDDLRLLLYKLSEYFTQIDKVNAEISEYIKVWGEESHWFDSISDNTAAMNIVMDGISSMIDYDDDLYENIGNANSFVNSFVSSISDADTFGLIAMSDGLKDGTVSLEEYNAAVSEFKSTQDWTSSSLPYVIQYLSGLSDKYVDISSNAEDARENTESLIDELYRLGEGGSVDLTRRPTISTNELIDAGWDVDPNEIATVFTSTYSNKAGTVAINFTPIIVDENGNHIGTLSEDELTEYAESVIAGTREDNLGLQIGAEFTGDDAIEKAEEAAVRIHELHEDLFPPSPYITAINGFGEVAEKVNSVSDSLKTIADLQNEVANGFTMSLDKALEFAAVYPEILNGATLSADGQISLNEDVVNSFISGKEAEIRSQVDAAITKLEADKETLEAKKAFAEAQLSLAQSVGEGEGQISLDTAMYRIQAGNAVAEALINAGMQEADAYRMACAAMAGNANEFDAIVAAVCTDVQGNFNEAAYSSALAIYSNMARAKTDIASLASQAHETARAIAAMGSGTVSGSESIKSGSGGGVRTSGGGISSSKFNFNGIDYQYDAVTFELNDFISQLKLDISEYQSAISQIDGQITILKALRDKDLGSFNADKKPDSSGGGSGNKGSGSSSGSDVDKVSDALEDAEKALRDAFKDYLNDMEHYISLLERNNNPESSVIDAYKRMMDAIHEEAERARANGEDEHGDYIQELQNQWWEYHDEIEKIREDITESAKDAVDDLVDYRIDMLKQQLEDEKDALNDQLDQLKEFYDKQKDMLRDKYDEEKYLEEQAEKRKAISDIEAELAALSMDDSAWAQKRRAELEAELAEANKELEDFEKDNAIDEVEKLLDEQYEKQEALIQSQIDAIEEKLNDPEALFNQALNDIRNSTEALYQEMVAYNAAHGDGNAETIKTFWEECFAALKDYEDLFGTAFNGVNMENATDYKESVGAVPTPGGSSDSGSGSSVSETHNPSTPSTPSTPAAPALEKGSYVQVKDGVKWYATSDGTGSWGRAKDGKIKYISKSGTHRYNIDGAGWVRKEDIVGYYTGTRHATAGVREYGEHGDEVIFTSSDGSRYRIFSDGEKVLNAEATNFLYDFAMANTGNMRNAWDGLIGNILSQVAAVGTRETAVEISTGDIIIQGNADERTVSDIRRLQRDQMSHILKELRRLGK